MLQCQFDFVVVVVVDFFLFACLFICSLRVEGTLPGIEVKISDTKLASLVKVSSCIVGGKVERSYYSHLATHTQNN